MSTKTEDQKKWRTLEIIKWFLAVVLLISAVAGSYFCRDYNPSMRTLIIVLIIVTAGGIIITTDKGKSVVKFLIEARNEMLKVIWPTRQETMYTTLIVATVTTILSLVLWGIDSILFRMVSVITNLRF